MKNAASREGSGEEKQLTHQAPEGINGNREERSLLRDEEPRYPHNSRAQN